jgi:hypothetical protein
MEKILPRAGIPGRICQGSFKPRSATGRRSLSWLSFLRGASALKRARFCMRSRFFRGCGFRCAPASTRRSPVTAAAARLGAPDQPGEDGSGASHSRFDRDAPGRAVLCASPALHAGGLFDDARLSRTNDENRVGADLDAGPASDAGRFVEVQAFSVFYVAPPHTRFSLRELVEDEKAQSRKKGNGHGYSAADYLEPRPLLAGVGRGSCIIHSYE